MKKALIYITSILLLISSFYSCESDDQRNPTTTQPQGGEEQGEESTNIETIISEITELNSGDWKITSAQLTNTQVTDLDITQLYNVQDDRFGLSSSSSTQLNVNWLEAYEINSNAADLQAAKSDNYKRSLQTVLTSSSTSNPYIFSDVTGDMILTYDQTTSMLTGQINNIEATLAITLTPVTTSDFQEIQIPQNFNLILSANTSQPVIGLNYSYATTSLFIMSHNSTELSLYKYQEDNETNTSISISDDAIGSDQFEFIDGNIGWMSAFSSAIIDYNLTQVIAGSGIDFTPRNHGTTSENNTVFAVGGYDGYLSDQIITLSSTGTSFLELGNMPSERAYADATIVDNDLYIFGGYYIDFNGDYFFYDSILKHDIITGNLLETIPLGVDLIDSYVSRKGELIYVAGNVLVTNSSNGGIGQSRNYFGVYNTSTNVLEEINIEDQLPTDRRIRGFAISQNAMYFAFDEINTDTGFWRMDVYRADLQ